MQLLRLNHLFSIVHKIVKCIGKNLIVAHKLFGYRVRFSQLSCLLSSSELQMHTQEDVVNRCSE